jgi:hypothetical protein
MMTRRKLRRAARSAPEPVTTAMPAADAARAAAASVRPVPAGMGRCGGCGRLAPAGAWCCWICAVAADGGWPLDPWSPGAPWTSVHTRACEWRQAVFDPAAAAVTAAWYAGTAAPRVPGPE